MIVPALLIAVAQVATASPDAGSAPAVATAGASERTAVKVGSVAAEYTWLAAHGLRPREQSLVVRGKQAFDMISALDEKGTAREVWFDISSFYGR